MNTADRPSLSNETVQKALTANTAQSVLNHLKALESNRARMLTRWIWELLQNARDTSPNAETCLVASVAYRSGELIFQHNGAKFNKDDIAHLIYHGSTKVEDEETIGQYGSGFLTTHLLSPTINVSGQLDDGWSFKFCLKREADSVRELSDSMAQAKKDFNDSLSTEPALDNFTTQFQYPIAGEGSAAAVRDGLKTLKRCAPFVVVFNKVFSRIDIKSSDETMSFEVTGRKSLSQDGFQEITVSENTNGSQGDRIYLLAEGTRTAVAVPLGPTDDGSKALLPIDGTPRLFLGFPLIGTEDFSFPVVINSFGFTPTEDRDGVYLWQSDNKANCENQAAMKEACDLLISLLRFAASSDWGKTHALANVPDINKQNWFRPDSFREFLKEQLIKQIRQIPTILCEQGVIAPKESVLPFAEEEMGVEALWALLDGLKELRQQLPRRKDAVGWYNAIKSWAAVCEGKAISFDEAFDGRRLASRIEKEDTLENLQKLLREDICAVKWLNQLYQFLKDNGLNEVIRTQSIILDQSGCLNELSKLYRDQGIAEELKDIAELLEWNIRLELRDRRLTSLADKVGVREWDRTHVVRELIAKLQERVGKNPDDNFANASARLFTWIVSQKDWDFLHGFPVFVKEDNSNARRVFRLEQTAEDDNQLLAPIGVWTEKLQQFSDLFPQRHILADAFFEAVSDPDVWRILDEQGFIRTNVVIHREVSSDTGFGDKVFLLDEPLSEGTDHRTVDPTTLTDIAFLTKNDVGIMARVRQNRGLAQLFWRFLTEWLIENDSESLELKEASCGCKETHHYFRAAWLIPLVENKWVPIGNRKSDKATAKSLASLLQDKPSSLNENPDIVKKLLKAIGVKISELTIALFADDDKDRSDRLDSTVTDILVAAGGNVRLLSELVGDLQDDAEGLFNHLEERREQRKMVQENQRLGTLVERLVKENLEDEDFTVTRTGTGSDYEIELLQGDLSWLVEVKATRGQEVRMSVTQARESVKQKGRFLLCVVPIESGNTEPELDIVRDKMRFVENIGSLVADLCNNLDDFEELRSNITVEDSPGIRLEVEPGSPRVRVASSVWEKDGFQLKYLAGHLR